MSKYGDLIRSKIASELIKVEIPEWGEDDEPMVVYTKTLTCGDFQKLQRKHPDFLNNQTIEGLVDLIILKAMDENGEKVFDVGDKPVFMRLPLSNVSDVAAKIMGNISTIEELEKN
jgi:hypothetical protein